MTTATKTKNAYTKQMDCSEWNGSEVVYYSKEITDQGAAKADIELLVKTVQDIQPEVGVSFGYIGNLERRSDDRQWYIWTAKKGHCHIGKDFAGSFERVKTFIQKVCI